MYFLAHRSLGWGGGRKATTNLPVRRSIGTHFIRVRGNAPIVAEVSLVDRNHVQDASWSANNPTTR